MIEISQAFPAPGEKQVIAPFSFTSKIGYKENANRFSKPPTQGGAVFLFPAILRAVQSSLEIYSRVIFTRKNPFGLLTVVVISIGAPLPMIGSPSATHGPFKASVYST